MLVKLSDRFYCLAKGRLILGVLAFFVLFVGFTMPLLPRLYPGSTAMTSLDAPAFTTPGEIFSILESWGKTGRTYQLWFHLTWDIVVPLLAFTWIGLSLSWLLLRAVQPRSGLRRLNLLALAAGFDWLENYSLAALVVAFPSRPAWLAWLKTLFTLGKYGSGIVIITLALVGLALAAKNRFKIQAA